MAGPVGRRVYATDPSKRRSPTKAKAKPKATRTIDMRSITEGPGGGVRAGVRIVGMAAAKSGAKEAVKKLARKGLTKLGIGRKASAVRQTRAPTTREGRYISWRTQQANELIKESLRLKPHSSGPWSPPNMPVDPPTVAKLKYPGGRKLAPLKKRPSL